MSLNSAYDVTEEGYAKNTPENMMTTPIDDKIYSYSEAINLAGNGWYSCSLMLTLSMTMLRMAMDILGFSVVVNADTCELTLDMWQTNILLSMPFIAIAYFVLNLEYSVSLGLMTLTPWRVLICILALPLGLAGLSLHFFYESPRFLLNLKKHEEALKNLQNIWRRNGGEKGKYYVKRVCLNEEGNISRKDVSLVQSLWEQFLPLFRPPLLKHSLELYFILAVVYTTNNGYLVWFPYLANKFVTGLALLSDNSSSTKEMAGGFCDMISVSNNITDDVFCSSHIEINLIWSTLTLGATHIAGLFILSFLTHHKRNLSCIVLAMSALCAMFSALVANNIISFIMFIGLVLNELCLGFILSYFVDLYPTSYRGMAACIGVMVSRGTALVGVNLLGEFTMSNCSASLYTAAAMNFAAAAATLLLPCDKPNKPK